MSDFLVDFEIRGEQLLFASICSPRWRTVTKCSPDLKFDLYVQYMYNAIMPTIFDIGPFRIIINTKDHRPAHVHCVGPGIFVIIEIATQEVTRNKGVSQKDIKRLQVIVAENKDVLMNEWRHYHEEE